MERKNVGIVIFDNVEVLDFCGPFEVFAITRLNEERRLEEPSPFNLFTVAERPGTVTCVGGLEVIPKYTFADCPPLEILVVPGGRGAFEGMERPSLMRWLQERATEVETVASVCTGAFLLAKGSLLDDRRATTHWAWTRRLKEMFPLITVLEGERVVQDGSIVTSAGVSAGIDMALFLVERSFGREVARQAARRMEYEGYKH